MAAPATQSTLLPLELVDKAIGSRIHIIMKNDKGGQRPQESCGLSVLTL